MIIPLGFPFHRAFQQQVKFYSAIRIWIYLSLGLDSDYYYSKFLLFEFITQNVERRLYLFVKVSPLFLKCWAWQKLDFPISPSHSIIFLKRTKCLPLHSLNFSSAAIETGWWQTASLLFLKSENVVNHRVLFYCLIFKCKWSNVVRAIGFIKSQEDQPSFVVMVSLLLFCHFGSLHCRGSAGRQLEGSIDFPAGMLRKST